MWVSKLFHVLLPLTVFAKLRARYHAFLKKIHKPLSEEAFRDILSQKLGVRKGKVVFIHSSLDFLNIDFSPFKLLGILIDMVGPEGTLVFPSWHFNYRAEDYLKKDLVFDLKRSPTVLGLLPELARKYPVAFRSQHPTTSVVAIGKHARILLENHEHSIYPCGEMSPFYKMMDYQAIIIGLGVTSHFLSFVHCPEDVLKDKFPVKTRTDEILAGKVKLPDDTVITVKTLAAHGNIAKRNIPLFLKRYVPDEIFSQYNIRGNIFFRAESCQLFDTMMQLAREGKTIYNQN